MRSVSNCRDQESEVLTTASGLVADRELITAVEMQDWDSFPLDSLDSFVAAALRHRNNLADIPATQDTSKAWGHSRWLAVARYDSASVIAKVLQLDPGAVIDEHAHGFRSEIHIVIGGVVARFREGCRHRSMISTPLSALVFPPGVAHSFEASSEGGVIASVDFREKDVKKDRIPLQSLGKFI